MGHRKITKGLVKRNGIWYIEKQINGQRIRKSTGTSDKREAETFLAFKLETHRKQMVYGDRRQYTFEQAATRYIQEETKKSLLRDAQDLKQVMPFIGHLPLEQVHAGTLDTFVQKRKEDGVKSGTVNRALTIVRLVLSEQMLGIGTTTVTHGSATCRKFRRLIGVISARLTSCRIVKRRI